MRLSRKQVRRIRAMSKRARTLSKEEGELYRSLRLAVQSPDGTWRATETAEALISEGYL